MKQKYGMVIDLHKCVGCGACDLACKSENNTPDGILWSNHINETTGVFPNVTYKYMPTLCNHCEDAPCVRSCPTAAMYKDSDTDMTLHAADKCIGCKSCILACPYDVISYNDRQPHTNHRTSNSLVEGGTFSTKEMGDKTNTPYPYYNAERGKTYPAIRSKGVVEKCNFCDHRVKGGLLPFCVDSCPADARIFGNLTDENSAPSKLLAKYPAEVLKEHKGTKPKVFYIRKFNKA